MDSVQDRDNACPNPEFTWPVLLQDFVCKNSVRGGCRWYGQRENHASKTELQPNDLGPFGNAIPSRGCEGTPVCCETTVRSFWRVWRRSPPFKRKACVTCITDQCRSRRGEEPCQPVTISIQFKFTSKTNKLTTAKKLASFTDPDSYGPGGGNTAGLADFGRADAPRPIDWRNNNDQPYLLVCALAHSPLLDCRTRSNPDHGCNRDQGYPEVSAVLLRAVVETKERTQIAQGTGGPTGPAQRSADPLRIHQ